jgi:hypothetical protein
MPIQQFEPSDKYRLVIFRETEKAWMVARRAADRDSAFWLPKSRIDVQPTGEKDGTCHIGEFEIPDWLAEKNGLLDDNGEEGSAEKFARAKSNNEDPPF